MKILVLNGSPKGEKSNSLKLTKAFVEGMNEVSDNSTEIVHLQEKNIKGCKGCFACWKATPGKCVTKDDMTSIIQEIVEADMIIYSFPLYYFSVPGVLKDMIDRMLPMVLPFMEERTDNVGSGSHPARYDMSGKKFAVISTCGFWSAAGNYDAVRGMFDHICGKDEYETIFCGQGELFSIPELSERTDEYLGYVRTAGKEYAQGAISADTRAHLGELLYPKEVFEEMADASWGIDRRTGEKAEESLSFTRQMAALYNKNRYDGKDRVLEICYTDLGKTYQIELTKDGSRVLTDGSLTATTRIDTPWQVWKDIAAKKLSGTKALGDHLYTVKGDFSLMIHWDEFFGQDKQYAEPAPKNGALKKPLLSVLLAMWITMWIAVSIDAFVGSIITIGVCVLMPIVMFKHEITLYDRLSAACVSALSVFALVTGNSNLACDTSDLAFGLMWLISAFTREPLCAAYVKYNYGGNEALENPLFVRTNKILAAAWGVLYIILAFAAFLMHSAGLNVVSLIVCNGCTALMGMFTVWFEHWYPAHIAEG